MSSTGVIVLPRDDSRAQFSQQVQQIFAEFDANRRKDAALKQNAEQFDRTFKQQQGLTDAQVSNLDATRENTGALTQKTKQETLAARANAMTANIFAKGEAMAKNGDHTVAGQWVATQLKSIDNRLAGAGDDPDALALRRMIAESAYAFVNDTPDTSADAMHRNAMQYGADASGRAAAGGQSPVDINFATKVATGDQMTPPAFGNQAQREMGPKALSQAVAVEGGRAPSANAELAARTQIQTGREGNASAERIAAARANATNAGMTGPSLGSGLSGDKLLQSLPPDLAEVVKKVAHYDIDPVQAASLRKGSGDPESERLQLIRLATQYDPSYDMTQFPARKQSKLDFSPGGKSANNIKSLNTTLDHIAELADAADALHNGNIQAINSGLNWAKTQFGGSGVTKFDNASTAVDAELATALKGAGATDQEIAAWRGGLSSNMSRDQQRAAILTRLHLMAGRLRNIADQPGRPADLPVLTPNSRKLLQTFGIDPDTIESRSGVTAPGEVIRYDKDGNRIQ